MHISSECSWLIFSFFCSHHTFKWDFLLYSDMHNLFVLKDQNVTLRKCAVLESMYFQIKWKVLLTHLIWFATDKEFYQLVSMPFYLEDLLAVFIMVKLLRERVEDGELLSRRWWWFSDFLFRCWLEMLLYFHWESFYSMPDSEDFTMLLYCPYLK